MTPRPLVVLVLRAALLGRSTAQVAPVPRELPGGEAAHNVFAPCDRNNIVAQYPANNDLLYPTPTPEAEGAECSCCERTRLVLEGYCKRQLPMGDLNLQAFNCTSALLSLETPEENARAAGDGSHYKPMCLAKCEAEHAKLAGPSTGCGLACTRLPECPPCAPPPPPPPQPSYNSSCSPVAKKR